ncbi:class I adenylate-forming enzyme family protein [Beggiatoa leptomitoformis]|uniref:AMP-binding protein n=1 Tax=Beggiatoa leptomitoformis TaxID=288004 RepID=A0A2N9YBE7_9GAMM|nr:fatty acid--CoA ligase family protein [Beggiatoa leptomitoformis]ALG66847.1 AMP-binding protein [Beggiatoa leptomitoformis]AUI67800.1 AMP-binding protein [Beggiatoa leptomitoformis]
MGFQRIFKLPILENTLSDGNVTCTYNEIPAFFAHLDGFFQQKQIYPQTGIAVEFVNSTVSALILLYLLDRNYSFFLFPPTAQRSVLPAFCHYHLLIQPTAESLACSPEQFITITINPDYDATLPSLPEGRLYLRTSGSMGMAKIVEHTHTALLQNACHCVERFQLTALDKVFLPVPIFHMYGLGAGFLPAVLAGACIELQDKTNIFRYLATDKRFQPTVVFLTPTLCKLLLKGCQSSRNYRLIVSAGDKMPSALFSEFSEKFGLLVNLYGSTEMGAVATSVLTDTLDKRASGHLQLMPTVAVLLADKTLQKEVEIGELCLQYLQGFTRYINEKGQAFSVNASVWFKTGDLASLLPEDYLVVWGRCDHSINRRGFLIVFAEIEKAMETLTGIEKAVIVPLDMESTQGQAICAYCTTTDDTWHSSQIREACFTILPPYAVPDEIVVIHEMPALPSGKVDRQALTREAGSKNLQFSTILNMNK